MARAALLHREALTLARGLDETRGTAEALEAMAVLLGEQGNREYAVRLFSAAGRLRERAAEPVRPSLRPLVEGAMSHLRAALGEDAYAAAWEAGQTTTLESVIAGLPEVPSSP